MARTVLVIGAAGKTGRAVTRALVGRGVRVRAAVRPGSTSRPYAAELASPVTVDLETGSGLGDAMAGADAVSHLAPNVHPGEVDIARRVVESAWGAGVSQFVFHSVLHPHDAAMPHHLRKGEAEKVIRARLPRATVLRPAAYHQNLVDGALSGRISVPYSLDVPFTNVDLDDVAEVAARVLTETGHEGRTYTLVGTERQSVRELADEASGLLGHEVVSERIALSEWLAGPGSTLDDARRAALMAMFEAYDHVGFADSSGDLAMLLGRPPSTWRDVLRRHRAA